MKKLQQRIRAINVSIVLATLLIVVAVILYFLDLQPKVGPIGDGITPEQAFWRFLDRVWPPCVMLVAAIVMRVYYRKQLIDQLKKREKAPPNSR